MLDLISNSRRLLTVLNELRRALLVSLDIFGNARIGCFPDLCFRRTTAPLRVRVKLCRGLVFHLNSMTLELTLRSVHYPTKVSSMDSPSFKALAGFILG